MSENNKIIDIHSIKVGNNGKRAHHNALERKRRDHIKDSFHGLRDVVPVIYKTKISRAQILKKATEYLHALISKNKTNQLDIEEIQKQNRILEQKILYLHKIRSFENVESIAPNSLVNQKTILKISHQGHISNEHSYSGN